MLYFPLPEREELIRQSLRVSVEQSPLWQPTSALVFGQAVQGDARGRTIKE